MSMFSSSRSLLISMSFASLGLNSCLVEAKVNDFIQMQYILGQFMNVWFYITSGIDTLLPVCITFYFIFDAFKLFSLISTV